MAFQIRIILFILIKKECTSVVWDSEGGDWNVVKFIFKQSNYSSLEESGCIASLSQMSWPWSFSIFLLLILD